MISYDAASNYMKLFCCFLPFPRRSASITIGIMQKTAEFNNISKGHKTKRVKRDGSVNDESRLISVR